MTKYQGVYQAGLRRALSSLGSSESATLFYRIKEDPKIVFWNSRVSCHISRCFSISFEKKWCSILRFWQEKLNCEFFSPRQNNFSCQKLSVENRKKKLICQQHPVFPGGHPSKYWRGSMLLNFGDRTRTGAFSMIWPLTRKVRADQRFHSLVTVSTFWKQEMALVVTHSHDGDGSEEFSLIDLCFHPRTLLTFSQNAVSKSWSPVALSGLEVFGLNQPVFQLIWHGSWVHELDK